MKNKICFLSVVFGTLFLGSCTPSVKYTAYSQNSAAKPADHPIKVFEQGGDPLPPNTTVLGEVTVGDTGFTVSECDYSSVLNKAKEKARLAGGDAIQVTMRRLPDIWSSCYRVKANIIAFDKSVPDQENVK